MGSLGTKWFAQFRDSAVSGPSRPHYTEDLEEDEEFNDKVRTLYRSSQLIGPRQKKTKREREVHENIQKYKSV